VIEMSRSDFGQDGIARRAKAVIERSRPLAQRDLTAKDVNAKARSMIDFAASRAQ